MTRKNWILIIVALVLTFFCFFAARAEADIIPSTVLFEVGDNGSFIFDGILYGSINSYDVNSLTSLNYLGHQETATVDFFDVTFSGFFYGKGNVTATLDFASPLFNETPIDIEGDYGAFSLMGFYTNGYISWEPVTFDYSYFNGLDTIYGYLLIDLFDTDLNMWCDSTFTVSGDITNYIDGSHGHPVAIPGSALLLGSGLIGLLAIRRNKN